MKWTFVAEDLRFWLHSIRERYSEPLRSDEHHDSMRYWPLSAHEKKVVAKVLKDMRRLQPAYHRVFRLLMTRSGGRRYHGFYTDLAKQLGITPNAVKYRLRRAIEWAADRIEKEVIR